VLLDQPGLVVAELEGVEGLQEVGDGGEALNPEQLLLQGPDESLGHSVPLRLPDVGRAAADAEEVEFRLVVARHELAAVVVAEGEACGDALPVASEALPDPLADHLEGLEAVPVAGRVDADALLGAVVDGDEDGGVALVGPAPVASVPHISSGRSVMMVPSCALGPWALPIRVGASSPASRISRSTRALLVPSSTVRGARGTEIGLR
jgi:hypothetical protein